MSVQFRGTPSGFSPQVNHKTLQGIAKSAQEFSAAETVSQGRKSGARLVLRWVGMGFKLIGQGAVEGVKQCFKAKA